MATIFLAWGNLADSATLSGGAWLSGLPLSNLQTRQIQRVARASSMLTSATRLDCDFGVGKAVGVVALVGHNLSALARVRVTGASDIAGLSSPFYSSGWVDVWPSGLYSIEALDWEETNYWLGTVTDAQRKSFQAPFILRIPSVPILRAWRVEIDDQSNPDGYVQVGRLFMARGWTPSINYAYGASLAYVDPTPVDVSLSGAEYFDVRPKARVFSLEFDALGVGEARQWIGEMQRVAGVSGEVLVMPDGGEDVSAQPALSFVGRLREMGSVSQPRPSAASVKFEIKEII